MSADGSVELFWGEGLTRFRLGIGELLALEDKFDVGCAALVERFRDGTWRLSEAREILRIGLVGGGAGMEASNRLIDRWFDRMGIAPLEHAPFAMAVLTAGLSRPVEDDGAGESTAEATATGASASSPPRSTAPAPSSDGRPPKSTPARSSSSRPRSKAGTRRKAETTPRSSL